MPPTTNDFDKEYRRLIEHETKLVDGRMKWFILFQSLLFAGFYNVFEKSFAISIVICLIGCIISIIIRHSFWKNEMAIAFIMKNWNRQLDELGYNYEDFPPIFAGYTDSVHLKRKDKMWSTFSPILLHHIAIPWLFFIAWIVILIIVICIKCGIYVE